MELAPYSKTQFGRAYGASPQMRRLFSLLTEIARTDTTVLIEGETGSGKELVAEGVHLNSYRSQKPYVVVDCGAIPRDLMGSELFGHIRGAFTGAHVSKRGLADEADGGTLMLDEIGELPLEMQPQFLRLLERREVRPIGETRSHRVDVRVIAATNRDLLAMVHAGQFREDLYYRLAVMHVVVPPLRDRRDDIPELVRIFLNDMGKSDFTLPEEVTAQLMSHDWPGNVRELRNVVERGLSLGSSSLSSSSEELSLTNLAFASSTRSSSLSNEGSSPLATPATPSEVILDLPFKEAKGRIVESFERAYLLQLLERHHGNISRAAQEAGIDRNYIHRLVKKYNIPIDRG